MLGRPLDCRVTCVRHKEPAAWALAVRGVQFSRAGREAETLAAGQDAAMAELGDRAHHGGRPTAGAAGAGQRPSPRVGPTGRQTQDGGPADPCEPEHRTRVRRHSPADDAAAERTRPPRNRRRAGPCWRHRPVRIEVDRVGAVNPAIEASTASADRPDVVDTTICEPSPRSWRTLASKRSRAMPRTDSLTITPTRRGRNGATQTRGRFPKRARRAPASTITASTRFGAP